MITIGTCEATFIRGQSDHLGYTRCGEHLDPSKGGQTYEIESRSLLRSAETDDRDLWVCAVCGRYVEDWPRTVREVEVTIEHTPCRIF